ncbi:MAG: glycogen debranching enzyme family protein [Alphaproteobacteria bacterium]|nr:glycogen debranching enzyme family protein [Alphaproteobacteria bacterium]
MVRFGRAICGDLQQAERREWWLANGLGGYAAGTLAGSLTRRYHGLLIAPVDPPLGRRLIWAKADAELVDGEKRTPLSTNRWGGAAIDPAGHVHIESFSLDGTIPVWLFAIGLIRLEARVWLEPGANTAYAAWCLVSAPEPQSRPLALKIRLIVNDRDHHSQTASGAIDPQLEALGTALRVRQRDFALTLCACGGGIVPARQWIENFDLPVERERGLSARDNHLQVGEARLELVPGQWVGIVGSLEDDPSPDLRAALARRQHRQCEILERATRRVPEMTAAPDWIAQLLLAADSFVFARPLPGWPDGKSVIAGYPWFGDWGRDTMICLPGLALAAGRQEAARDILLTFGRFVDRGMLPNVFPGAGDKPEYNTVDAALWFIEAWRAYVEASGDRASLGKTFEVLADIVEWHLKGTRYGIRVDPHDGLLGAGEPGMQLTWMDAKIDDWVVTPRIGKPVEINALWYNALCVMAEFAKVLGLPAAHYRGLAERTRAAFVRFADGESGGLYDVIDGPSGNDGSVRPSQILAVSLPYSPIATARQAQIVALCGKQLLTSYGLRSLSVHHPDYRPYYAGDPWRRDGAYHQGTVWAWLLGHYALAEFRVYRDADLALQRLAVVRDHLFDGGLGTISEIFDAAAPHTPVGAPSQAWSVACMLEAWWRLQRARGDGEPNLSGGHAA